MRRTMGRRWGMLVTFLLVALVAVFARQGFADACKTATWDVYVGLADCTIRQSTLSHFEYMNDAFRALDPKMITATPDPDLIGLDFTFTGFTLGEASRTRTIEIKFKITDASGVLPYVSELLDMSARDRRTGVPLDVVTTGAGVATIADDGLSLEYSSAMAKLMDMKFFSPPVASVNVADTLKLAIGMNGSAEIKAYKVLVQSVPEPGTWLLFGTGLLGLFAYGWRHRPHAA